MKETCAYINEDLCPPRNKELQILQKGQEGRRRVVTTPNWPRHHLPSSASTIGGLERLDQGVASDEPEVAPGVARGQQFRNGCGKGRSKCERPC